MAANLAKDKKPKKVAKLPEKEQSTMKTTTKTTTKTVIVTVTITIVTIGALITAFIAGMNYQADIHNQVVTQANEIAKLKR